MNTGAPAVIAVLRKWADRRPEVDRLTGKITSDERLFGPSDADDAAMELALSVAGQWGVAEVVSITAGPAQSAAMARDALALGCSRSIRIDLPPDAQIELVAQRIAFVARGIGAEVIFAGAMGLSRGSGAVPALLAARLGFAQVLGAISVDTMPDAPGSLDVWRRLDGGRREHVMIESPCVVSVEGGVAQLRRAPLGGVLGSSDMNVELVTSLHGSPETAHGDLSPVNSGPYRPRTRVVTPPPRDLDARQRVLSLTDADAQHEPNRAETLEPERAAEEIIEALRRWEEPI